MIRFHQVSKRYPNGYEALRHVSFHVPRASMTFLTGHSGAGKSTLLRLITLTDRASRGQVIIQGKDIANLKRRQVALYRRRIGTIFQDHKLLYDRSVFDNVALPLVVSGTDHREIGHRARAALDKVGLLGKEKLNPITLSGGEQQRVGIARAVVNRPAILLADEPTGNLDTELADEIMSLFQQFQRYQVTVLVATHDQRHISRIPARVLELRNGSLIRGGGGGEEEQS